MIDPDGLDPIDLCEGKACAGSIDVIGDANKPTGIGGSVADDPLRGLPADRLEARQKPKNKKVCRSWPTKLAVTIRES